MNPNNVIKSNEIKGSRERVKVQFLRAGK